jgi:hypothetical protein
LNLGGTLLSSGITNTGAITATGDITAFYSDARLKQNVRPISDPLVKLAALRGVEWEWRHDKGMDLPEGSDAGVIAQEVQEVFPTAVGENGDYLGMKTSNHAIVGLLIEAVKAQQKQIDELRVSCARR